MEGKEHKGEVQPLASAVPYRRLATVKEVLSAPNVNDGNILEHYRLNNIIFHPLE